MRLHELAKKFGYNQQDLLTAVQKQGFDVKDTLTVVDGEVESWVAGKVAEGWTPPPPVKKAAKKKKVVMVMPPNAEKSAESEEDSAKAAEAEFEAEGEPETETPETAKPVVLPIPKKIPVKSETKPIPKPEVKIVPAAAESVTQLPEIPAAPLKPALSAAAHSAPVAAATGAGAPVVSPAAGVAKPAASTGSNVASEAVQAGAATVPVGRIAVKTHGRGEGKTEHKPGRTGEGKPEGKGEKVVSAPHPVPDRRVESPKTPVVIKRVSTPIKGSAAVGQASPEMIAAIKRSAAGASGGGRGGHAAGGGHGPGGGASGAGTGHDDERRGAARSGGPGGGRPPPRSSAPGRAGVKLEPVIPEVDLSSGKLVTKQRTKNKSRPTQDEEREVAEKKAKLSKRSKSVDEDWGIDDDSDYSEVEETPVRGETAEEQIDSTLLASAGESDRSGASFKHKRADFKSKHIQHELPASFAEIDNEFTRSIAGGGRRRGSRKTQRRVVGRRSRTRRFTGPQQRSPDQEAVVRLGMTLRDLSVALGVKLQDILGWLLGQGEMLQVNDILTAENITKIAEHYNIPIAWESDEDLEEELAQEAQQQEEGGDEEDIVERPPVVTFMGHVDHGKTSLLDAIRNTRVVAGEHGGITQHIGAYSVERDGKRVSFLDTPGHEAFSAMRARGANLTDIAVLVVAADDGVMPQTEEAAAHAKNAGVPIVVAINKCDLAAANPDRVRQELANRLGILPEEWGGQVGMVEVSAHTKKGIDDLVERILLEAEVLELRANPSRPATGFVVEAKMSEGQGVVATLLVSDGTLHNGDVILCSNGYGKIRFMFDEFGRPIESAGPGSPVRVSGLSAVPEVGDKFFILSDLLKARAIAEQRERESRQAAMAKRQHVTLENLTSHLAGSGKRELSVIVKADVVGSLEVIDKTLSELATSEVGINIIHQAVGGINHADVILADASDAVILGFHVGVESQARSAALSLGVQIKTYHIIYRMIEDMRAALEGLLPPEEKEVVQGHVDIRQVFRSSKVGAIAGCYVTDGAIHRTDRVRVYRSNLVVYDGTIQSLRRVKDDAREIKAGFECGIKIAGYDGIEEGDMLEAYAIEEIARKL